MELKHHAYLIVGSAEKGHEHALRMLAESGVPVAGNPDVLSLPATELSVGDSRSLSAFASLNAIGAKKYIIVSFSRATAEAQNALLKTLEEAPGNSIFFVAVDAEGHVLPTIRSRTVLLRINGEAGESTDDAKAFLAESYEKRLARVEKMASFVSKNQDRAPARSFITALLRVAHSNAFPPRALRDLLEADRYLRLQGSSTKSILGHLAVSLPHTK
jgi:hypothetical protein